MNLTTVLYSLASIPMFASRPFLAAFVTALLARVGDHLPFLASSDVVQALSHAPEWFQSWTTIGILALLATGEVLASKNSDVRAFMEDLDGWIKSGVSLAVALALVDSQTVREIEAIQRHGLSLESLWAVVVAVGTYFVALFRRGALWAIHAIDDDDDIGLQTALNWIENTWTVSGILFLVVFPVVALVLSALTALALWWIKRWNEKREERSRVPCGKCATPLLPHATTCHICLTEVREPRAVSVFGTPKSKPCADRARQRFDLIGRKRCPICATRLKQRTVQQSCVTCRTVTFASEREFRAYLEELGSRMPKALLVSFAFSAIPLVGVVPGVVYYRLALISGLRGYVPPVRGCVSRALLIVIRWVLIALQPIPILGALVVPLMCLSSYLIYRRALVGHAAKDLAPRPAV